MLFRSSPLQESGPVLILSASAFESGRHHPHTEPFRYPRAAGCSIRPAYMIYGHIHNNTNADYWPLIASRNQMLNAGVDINGFAPVTLHEMIKNNQRFKESV